jgi:hypothetical protein
MPYPEPKLLASIPTELVDELRHGPAIDAGSSVIASAVPGIIFVLRQMT